MPKRFRYFLKKQVGFLFVILAVLIVIMHFVSIACAITPSPAKPSFSVSIQSFGGSYVDGTIPLTVDLGIYHGSYPYSHEVKLQQVSCKCRLDNDTWKDIPFIEVISSKAGFSLIWAQEMHEIHCNYSSVLQGLSDGVHFIEVIADYPYVSLEPWQLGASLIYFEVNSSMDSTDIVIVPEFSSALILSLVFFAVGVSIDIYRRKKLKH